MRSMERSYCRYKLEGTDVHVMCTNMDVLIEAVHTSHRRDWVLEGVYDVVLTKDKESSDVEHMLRGLKDIVGDGGAGSV